MINLLNSKFIIEIHIYLSFAKPLSIYQNASTFDVIELKPSLTIFTPQPPTSHNSPFSRDNNRTHSPPPFLSEGYCRPFTTPVTYIRAHYLR